MLFNSFFYVKKNPGEVSAATVVNLPKIDYFGGQTNYFNTNLIKREI